MKRWMLVPFALLRRQNKRIRSNENPHVFSKMPLGFPKKLGCILMFDATVFGPVFFNTEDYDVYRD
jgi:hypothetical protein